MRCLHGKLNFDEQNWTTIIIEAHVANAVHPKLNVQFIIAVVIIGIFTLPRHLLSEFLVGSVCFFNCNSIIFRNIFTSINFQHTAALFSNPHMYRELCITYYAWCVLVQVIIHHFQLMKPFNRIHKHLNTQSDHFVYDITSFFQTPVAIHFFLKI